MQNLSRRLVLAVFGLGIGLVLAAPSARAADATGTWKWTVTTQNGNTFETTLKLVPAFYPAEAGLGYVELARKDPKAAVSHFDNAVVMNPRYVPALVGRGEALLALGSRDQALQSFEAAIASDADLSELRSRIDGHETAVVIHNDAVVQGLSELPAMQDYERWGVLTIGTGLGNARFTNRRDE